MAKRLEIQLYNAKTGESLTLPLNPETIDIPNEKEEGSYNILGFGEVSVRGNRRLRRISLSNILPNDNSYLALLASLIQKLKYKPYSLKGTIDMLNRWVNDDQIIRVIISDRLNEEFRIERHISQVRESIVDTGYTIDLVEHRNPFESEVDREKQKKIETKKAEPKIVKLKKRAINKFIPSEKVLEKGMTVYKLAKLTYGDRFTELANLNSIINLNSDLTGAVVEMLPL